MANPVERLKVAISLAEDAENHEMAFRLAGLTRQINAARQVELKVENWLEFKNFWEDNRSPQLLYALADVLGDHNPLIKQLHELLAENDKLDHHLHEIYLQLKAGRPAAPPQKDQAAPPPAAITPPPAPAAVPPPPPPPPMPEPAKEESPKKDEREESPKKEEPAF